MPISDPLDIGWDHAYWTEGPEFEALGLSDGAAVAAWPDEVGTYDLTQSTGDLQPAFDVDGLNATRPSVLFQGGDKLVNGATTFPQPSTRVLIAELVSLPGLQLSDADLISRAPGSGGRHLIRSEGNLGVGRWVIYAGSSEIFGTPSDLDPHLLVGFFNGASSYLHVDGTQVLAGNPGSNSSAGIGVGSDGAAHAHVHVSFIGIIGRALTSEERADLLDWYDSHYLNAGSAWTPGPVDLLLGVGSTAFVVQPRFAPAPVDLVLDLGVASASWPTPVDPIEVTPAPVALVLDLGMVLLGIATRPGDYPNPDDEPGWTARAVTMTGELLFEIPHVLEVSVTEELNTETQAAFSVPKYDPTTALLRSFVEVQLYRNGDLMAWGPVLLRGTSGSAGTMTFAVRDVWWYLRRRFFGTVGRSSYLRNGGFEAAGGWTAAGVTFELSTTRSVYGDRSARLEAGPGGGYLVQSFGSPGTTRRNTLWATALVWVESFTGPADEERGLWVGVHGPDGLRETFATLDEGAPLGEWIPLTVGVNYLPDDTEIEVRLYCPDGAVFWDDVVAVRTENTGTGFDGADQASFAAGVVRYAQTGRGKSSVALGTAAEATGVIRTRRWDHHRHDPVEAAVAELVGFEDGIDWSIDLTPTTRTFRTHFPMMGRDLRTGPDALVLRLGRPGDGGNLSDYTYEEDVSEVVTSHVSLGWGDGPTRFEGGSIDTSSTDGLILEAVEAAPEGMEPRYLTPWSESRLDVLSEPIERLALTSHTAAAAPDGVARLIHDLRKGDLVRVEIEDGPVVIDADYRVTRRAIRSRPETVALSVELWEP